LQDARDQAVAAGDPAASVLQRQVATAQQEAFDLDAVARRRVELVDARRDAAAALERFSRRGTSDEIGSESGSLPLWRIVLAGLLFAGALAVAALVVVGSRRPPRRAARSRTPRSSSTLPSTNPQPRLEPQPEAELEADPVARLSLDEIEQRLAALEHD
jgi:hypothetical protein